MISHEQAGAQCARFLRESLPGVTVRAASSTAEAVRMVSVIRGAMGGDRRRPPPPSSTAPWSCATGSSDEPDNVTRFVWVAPSGVRPSGDGLWRTTLIFSELGEDHPGALVDALTEFSSRAVNLTRLESRPLRRELGRYMFFVDIEGPDSEPEVAEAIEALRTKGGERAGAGQLPGQRWRRPRRRRSRCP